MKRLIISLLVLLFAYVLHAQDAFIINNFDVKLHLTQDGVIEVTETLDLTFSEERHGIIRNIPYRFSALADVSATRPFSITTDEIETFITNIEVDDWEYQVSTEGDYKNIRIGSPDTYVNGKQRYVIRYKIYNAINFFEDHSELYWNITGNEWDAYIDQVTFNITWDQVLPTGYSPNHFVATGYYGSTGADATGAFGSDRRSFSGKSTKVLGPHEGVTVGIAFPDQFLRKTPIPPDVIAENFYIKNEEIDIRILENGVAEVTERYTIVPVVQTKRISRNLSPYLNNQKPSLRDWLGGRTRFLVANVKVTGGKLCNPVYSNSICLDLSDTPVGKEKNFEIKYRTYAAFEKSERVQKFMYKSLSEQTYEPVVRSSIDIELPAHKAESIAFDAGVQDYNGFIRAAQVRQLSDHHFTVSLSGEEPYLLPNESLGFQLILPDNYFSESVLGYDLRLFWLNNRWLFLPILIFAVLYEIWIRWGRDEDFAKMVHYYPPEDLPPSEAGILIDDKLHDRDLLALIPYWGAHGYIEVTEVGKESIWKKDDYIFKLVKRISDNVPDYERKMFNGIFKNKQIGTEVKLSSLKNKFYKVMDDARKALEKEIKRKSLYMPYTRGAGTLMKVLGTAAAALGGGMFVLGQFFDENFFSPELGFGLLGTGILSFVFGRIMPKKAPIGLEKYKELAGFELFVKDAELSRLETFMKEDPHYFDKTLPYAIVFDHVDKWTKKFEALTVKPPEPSWYHSTRYGAFSTHQFTQSLNSAMRDMGNTFASQPSSSGSSGGSFGGGGGFSGGGFGGGGGSSW